MPYNWKKENSLALIIALVLHLAVVGLLLWIVIPKVEPEEQGAVLVNIGDIDLASGTFSPVSTEPISKAVSPPDVSTPQESGEDLLTQEDDQAPVVNQTETPKKKEVKKVTPNRQVENKARQAEAEAKRRAEAEARERARQERVKREKAEAEARRKAEINKSVSGAFGAARSQGSGDANKGEGQQGSVDGNVSTGGANSGIGGYGSYDLGGRNLVGGALPKPSYSSQVEGRIVIKITVDPKGKVIATNIAPGTTIEDYQMKQSALKSAATARFNAIKGLNNQVGTITYVYRLK